LPGLRNFNPASALSPRPQEMPAVIGRATLEAAAEDQLMPRLRKADPLSAAVPAVPFTAPAVKQVWRQSQSPSREPSGEARGLPAAAQTAAADSPTHHRVDLLPPAPASAVLPAKVEGPTMERIAEDVMKRIERHLRIERERRGM
jgi:hypothetical protein